jgi:hypothetical protein
VFLTDFNTGVRHGSTLKRNVRIVQRNDVHDGEESVQFIFDHDDCGYERDLGLVQENVKY